MAAGDTPCNTHTIQVWYISLHLVDFYGKNVGKYTIHGLFGYVFFVEKKHMKKPLQAQTAKKSRSGLLFGQRIHEKKIRFTSLMTPMKSIDIADPQKNLRFKKKARSIQGGPRMQL